LTYFPPALRPQAKKFLKEVTDFAAQCNLEIKNTQDSKALYSLMAEVMVRHSVGISAKIKIPLTMKLVLQTTSPLVSLFDNLFPNYVRSGLVKTVFLASKKGKVPDEEVD
jgi:adenylylsulfate kinase-like enzyme